MAKHSLMELGIVWLALLAGCAAPGPTPAALSAPEKAPRPSPALSAEKVSHCSGVVCTASLTMGQHEQRYWEQRWKAGSPPSDNRLLLQLAWLALVAQQCLALSAPVDDRTLRDYLRRESPAAEPLRSSTPLTSYSRFVRHGMGMTEKRFEECVRLEARTVRCLRRNPQLYSRVACWEGWPQAAPAVLPQMSAGRLLQLKQKQRAGELLINPLD